MARKRGTGIEANKESGDRAHFNPISDRHFEMWDDAREDANPPAEANLFKSTEDVNGTLCLQSNQRGEN